MSEAANKFSFAELIRLYRIEIPIIQRDYAQGRNNSKAKSIRDTFVSDLYSALYQPGEMKKPLELAFIYGRVENGVFVPVDGQQRLTTLYLVHLYLVKRCMAIETSCDWCPHGNPLARFTYATRQSSREFCESIVSPDKQIIPPPNKNLKTFVEEQPWFFVEWKFDPTISGMLEVLEVIHKKFDKTPIEKKRCVELLSRLYGEECPIQFHFLDMGHHSLTDDLYLKMNARGLPLTALENMKCSLENYCDDCDDTENKQARITPGKVTFKNLESGKELPFKDTFSVGKRISSLCDHAWLDFFWRIESDSAESNATMMVIIARLFALYVFEKDILPDRENFDEKDRKLYEAYWAYIDEKLLNIKGNEDFIPFEVFQKVLEWNGVSNDNDRSANVINYIAVRLNRMALHKEEMVAGLLPYWDNPENASWSAFLGELKSGKSWKQYAALYAVLSFLDYVKQWDKNEFTEWMRVQWNIIENGTIDSFEQMQRYVKFCSSLVDSLHKTGCSSVLKYLAEKQGDGGLFKDQVQEEVIKAKLMCNDDNVNANREAIKEAEKLPWFHGRIGAILQDDQIDGDLREWFSKETVGTAGSQTRLGFVRKIISYIELQYKNADPKPSVDFYVKSNIESDPSLKEAIYDTKQGKWIKDTRTTSNSEKSVWLGRMNDGVGNEGWKKCIKLIDRGGGVYAYRVSNITGAYRLDEKIDWWYDFINESGAKTSRQTNDQGTWIQCEIESGDYKGVYALYHDETASFAQKMTDDHGWYPPSNEDARKIWKENVDTTNQNWVESLLKRLNQKQA